MTDPVQHDIDRATQRAALYWLQDGLNEMTTGVIFVLVGAYLVLEGIVPDAQPLKRWLVAGFPLLVIALAIATRRVVMVLKDRYVHPRTGYVTFRQKGQRSRWFAGILAAAIASLVAVIAGAPQFTAWIPALIGLLLAVMFLVGWRKVPITRFLVEAAACLVAGIAVSSTGIDENVGSGLVFTVAGIAMGIGGLLAFRSYLRTAPTGEDA
jgi:lysylphosphatidylglycerol synthetase-like protein (DUF2156 family)